LRHDTHATADPDRIGLDRDIDAAIRADASPLPRHVPRGRGLAIVHIFLRDRGIVAAGYRLFGHPTLRIGEKRPQFEGASR
jgi:hypothetical protein